MRQNDLAAQFEYLDNLRESGITNMFGAAPYLASYFSLEEKQARKVLGQWMDTFDGESSPTERAEKAEAV